MILDSESEFFTTCLENSPAVLDHSHVVWLDKWDEKTMNIIPEIIFKKLYIPIVLSPIPTFISVYFDFRNKIMAEFPDVKEFIPYFSSIHQEAETWMNTCPRRYISFIQTFSVLLLNKQESINKRMAHLKVSSYTVLVFKHF